MNLFGYAGQTLRVNLTTGEIKKEPTLHYAREWLGSTGIAVKILYDELKAWTTPYDPANKIVFGTGALMGTPAPGACKMSASTLGPRTGGWASGCCDSYVGGELKCAGYDTVVIEGRAGKPVYLWIQDDRVEIRDASHLWGKNTWETLEIIRNDLNDPSLHILSIGPAGENLVRGACIVQDRARAFGRCGTGAVMGSKNLKALVAKGSGAIKVAQPEDFMEAVRHVRDLFKTARGIDEMRHYGTLKLLAQKQAVAGVNYKNFQEVQFPEAVAAAIDPKKSIDKYGVAKQNFPGCPIGCGNHLQITEGPYAGLSHGGEPVGGGFIDSGTVGHRGANLHVQGQRLVQPARSGCRCRRRRDRLGHGVLSKRHPHREGYGRTEAPLGGRRRGPGTGREDRLPGGVRRHLGRRGARAADLVGRESGYYAMHLKGQDLYEPCRGNLAWCLGTTTSTRGGGHTTGAVETLPGMDFEKMRALYGVDNPDKVLEYEGKARMVVHMEAVHRVNNCLGICHFNTIWANLDLIDLPHMAELYSTATGWPTSVDDLKRIAERQLNLEKAFNLRFTPFDRKDDMPTPRDLAEPIPTGPMAGWKMDRAKFNGMLDEYYDLHGWNRESSFPTRKTLTDLGLKDVADDLEAIGKLGNP